MFCATFYRTFPYLSLQRQVKFAVYRATLEKCNSYRMPAGKTSNHMQLYFFPLVALKSVRELEFIIYLVHYMKMCPTFK